MACIRRVKTKKGIVYYLDYVYQDKRYVRSTKSSDFAQAKKILQQIQGKIASQTFNLSDYKKKTITLNQFFEEYFRVIQRQKSEKTILNEGNYARKFTEFIGDIDIRTIDAHLMAKWKADRLTKGSPTTFNIERRTLQAIFARALKWGFAESNPFKTIEKVKVEGHRLYLTDVEIEQLFAKIDIDIANTASKRNKRFLQRFRLFVEFLLNTGLRRSEALNLKLQNVHFENDSIWIEKTKSKVSRPIPLNQKAKEILLSIGEELFCSLNANHVTRKFQYFARKAGLHGFKLHSLRHTFATNLIEKECGTIPLRDLLGHKHVQTTEIYGKAVLTTALRKAVRLLDVPQAECKESVRVEEGGQMEGQKVQEK